VRVLIARATQHARRFHAASPERDSLERISTNTLSARRPRPQERQALGTLLTELASGCKYTYFDETPGSTHNLVTDLVPNDARVLEFGCATGYMSRAFRERRGCTVVGVELVPEAAAQAQKECERVIVADAETIDYDAELGEDRFDAITFADVLEHLRDPARLLRRIRPFLKEDGAVIASIPNVAHGNVRLALLAGEFRYRQTGLLDETHLRFFTRNGVRELFEQAGLFVHDWLYKRLDIGETEIALPELPFNSELQNWLELDHNSTVYQFIVRGRPADAAAELAETRRALNEATEELTNLRRHSDNLEGIRTSLEQELGRAAEGDAVLAYEPLADDAAEALRAKELHQHVRSQKKVIDALRSRVVTLTEELADQRSLLRSTHEELIERDHELREITAASKKAEARLAEVERTLHDLHQTRAWHTVGRFWQAKSTARRLLGFGR
jgi:2-polyprenyl-3-methyl-5-hydroxy-6-metoxy-1,4-benzoquinol methylase